MLLTCMRTSIKGAAESCALHDALSDIIWHWLAGSLRALACWADSDTPLPLAALPTASPLQSVRCLDIMTAFPANSGLIRCLALHGRAH